MTPSERENPKIINGSRRLRIANGSGVKVNDVNQLVDRFFEARKMMSQMGGVMPGMRKRSATKSSKNQRKSGKGKKGRKGGRGPTQPRTPAGFPGGLPTMPGGMPGGTPGGMPGNFPGQLPPGMDPNSLPDISKLKFPKK
jgi:signal recognition particle subunit SRP54